jgi:hypothetical protein
VWVRVSRWWVHIWAEYSEYDSEIRELIRRDIATSGYKRVSANSGVQRLIIIGARVFYRDRRWYVHITSAFSLLRYYRILFT